MSKILRISNSDYRVKVQDGGNIVLDTGVAEGTVYITGDLVVEGETTTVNTTNLEIEDNIINLNIGELGSGITEGTSGLNIVRGSLSNAQLLFDEESSHYDPRIDDNRSGTFVLKTADGVISGLKVNSITVDSTIPTDIVFDLQNSDQVLRIENADATAYASRIGPISVMPDTPEDNYLVNKKYVTGYVSSGIIVPGMADVDRIYFSQAGVEKSRAQAFSTFIEFAVNQVQRAKITSAGLDVDNVNLYNNTITNTSSNNLVVTSTSGNVEINAYLNLDDQAGTPAPEGSKTKIYSSSTATYTPGDSGIYFVNSLSEDELIAKNRALLFSMLF